MEKDGTKDGFEMVRLSDVVDRKEFIARAEACLEQDPARAVEMALERLRVYPDDTEARIVLGMGWFRKGEPGPALDVLRDLVRDVTRWSPAFRILSELCREKGLEDEAERASRIYMSLNPESAEAIQDLEDRLRRESRAYPEAVEKADEEAGLPRAADFKTLTLADLYARQGYRELAEALLKEILAADPQNRDALERLGRLRSQAREDAGPPLAAEDAPVGGEKDLFFGDPAAPPFEGLFSRTTRIESLEEEPKTEVPVDRPAGACTPDRRPALIGTLNRWLDSLERTKRHA
jgi:predicted Zn-dependent protease